MPKSYISLDLETTGLVSAYDSIIEVGALRFQGEKVLETFSSFVNPGRHIPAKVTELTGITDSDVLDAPPVQEVMRELERFVGRDPVIGHNIGFDMEFLHRQQALLGNETIDTFNLASILVPHAGRYTLENLVRVVGLDFPPQTHRALDDARMAHALYVELLKRATQLPPEILEEIAHLGERFRWGARHFFRDALRQTGRRGFQGGIGAQLAARRGGDRAGPLFLAGAVGEPLHPREEPTPLDVEALSRFLDEDGPLAAAFSDYEARPQQREMLEAVARAFNEGHHLLVEAGTGTGKSLAYLIPAVQWALQNEETVLISTNTINLQEQLIEKDIPLLEEAFPQGFRASVLKGRSHYLCRRQWQAMRQRGPTDPDEMVMIAKVLLWLPNTLDGDGDQLFMPTAADRRVWARLSASRENCSPYDCPFYESGTCFLYRARDRARASHIVVVNHALLLADAATENRLLPPYRHLIVDEAHHLEHATTEALHRRLDRFDLRRLFAEILGGRRSGPPSLIDGLFQLQRYLSRDVGATLQEWTVALERAAEETRDHLDRLIQTLERWFDSEGPNRRGSYTRRLRITAPVRRQSGWESVEAAWDAGAPAFERLIKRLRTVGNGLDDVGMDDLPTVDTLRARLSALQRHLDEDYAHLRHFTVAPQENEVYWMEADGRDEISLHSAPLEVAPLVEKQIWQATESAVLTSATMRVGGSFDYLKARLGAWEAETLAVGSPFDYRRAALLYAVNDLPEPGQAGYQRRIEETMLRLFLATEGRALALFTSYSQLRATAEALAGPLQQAGIFLYAQGMGSSRAQLLANFRRSERSVLLGTRSFWEGVDIPGEHLSCLVIAKLPFDVPNDPLVEARGEQYDSAFNDYLVPEAILRFLQGFGRLIRTRTDRGVVAVLDRRLLSKRYGRRFLESLPGPTLHKGRASALPQIAADWLAGRLSPEDFEQEADEGWSVPPPEAPPDWW